MKISKITSLFLAGTISLFIIGCGGGGGGNSSSSASTSSTVSGSVVDGPIANAKVCVDYNFNGVCDNNEPSAETNSSGEYVLTNVDLSKPYPIIVVPQNNTIDTSTLQKFTKKLSAPLNGTKINVNPITTLVGAQLYVLKKDNNLTKQAVEKLQEVVAQSVDLNTTDLTQVDIMKYPKVYAKAVALFSILPDNNQSITEINNKIDFKTLQKDHNLTSCIKDENVSNVINQINNLQINNLKPEILETIIYKAIEGNESILDQNQASWEEIYKNTIINNFIDNLGFTPLSITNNDFSNKLVLTQDDSTIFFNNNGTYKEDANGKIDDGNWSVQDSVLELNESNNNIFVAIKDKNGSLVSVKGYDSEDGWWNDEAAILNATEDTTVNSGSDYLALFDQNTPIENISDSDFANQTKYADGEKYTFNDDGTFTDSWEENGQTVTETGTWSIENNKVLVMKYNSGEDNGITAYVVFIGGNKVVYIDVDTNGKIVSGGVDNINEGEIGEILVSDLVAGKVTFYDENGSVKDIPQNAKIRITPKEYQVDGEGNWQAVNCIINSDGTFGDKCYIEINENDMKEALENNESQIVVYDDANNDFHWESDENNYFYEDTKISNLKDIDINITISK